MTSQTPAETPDGPGQSDVPAAIAWTALLVGCVWSVWLADWSTSEQVFSTAVLVALGSLLVGRRVTGLRKRRESE